MHDYNLLVGQLDLDSILMSDKTELAVPRLNKFSKSKILFPGQTLKEYDAQAPLGRTLYWAPELCMEEAYDFKIDIWSFGVILYFLLTGQTHVPSRKDEAVQRKEILEKDYLIKPLEQRNVSVHAMDLVKRCLTKDPNKRLTSKQVLQHAWFKAIFD